MRISRLLASSAVAALLLGSATAQAEEAKPFTLSGSVAFVTDYVFRGVSQTSGDPALQVGLNLETEQGFFVGTWASNVNFAPGDPADVEVDFFGGYSNSVGDFSYTATVLYYAYPDSTDYNYWEFGLDVEYPLGEVTASGKLYWTPDYSGETGNAVYVAGGLSLPINDVISVSGGIGYQMGEAIDEVFGNDVLDVNIGVSATVFELDWDLRLTDTDIKANENADTRVVLSLSKSF